MGKHPESVWRSFLKFLHTHSGFLLGYHIDKIENEITQFANAVEDETLLFYVLMNLMSFMNLTSYIANDKYLW